MIPVEKQDEDRFQEDLQRKPASRNAGEAQEILTTPKPQKSTTESEQIPRTHRKRVCQ